MEQIGRYQILDELGRGAMGVVYRAQDPAIGRIIAVKTIRLTDLTDPEERQRLRERLFREAQSAGILSHPNIVTIYDIAEENGSACIFMEYVNGPSLEALLADRHPPEKSVVLNIFRQTAAALDYAHKKGIVHRDIKPANIMIHEDGQAKITDFGVAKVISHQMTQSGNMMGTPNYMSPEQVQGLHVDGAADQFALGVIAYEVLTGEKPFVGEYLPTLLYKIVRENPVSARRLNPTLGAGIEAVLNKALDKDPRQRYASCTEFVYSLIEACNAADGWMPLPRGTSQTLPTMGGTPPPPRAAARPAEPAQPAYVPIPRSLDREPVPERNPLVRSVIWLLAGIGLVGLVLLGTQRFLFNSPAATQVAAQSPPAVSEPPAGPPKPSPAGDPAAATLPADDKGGAAKQAAGSSTAPAVGAEQPRSPGLREETPAKVAPERSTELLTDPPGATVTVDGNPSLACKTPCMLSLTVGRHTLNTQMDGYRPYPRVFNTPADAEVFLKLTQSSGTLNITSNPEGAAIQINGENKPQKTPATFVLAPGAYRVRVMREGVPLEFEVQVKDGEFQTRTVNFQ